MESNHKPVKVAKQYKSVSVKIQSAAHERTITFGRHFNQNDLIYTKLTRKSVDLIKEHHKDSLTKDEWKLVARMKKPLNII